jgi:hypothetical protein
LWLGLSHDRKLMHDEAEAQWILVAANSFEESLCRIII